jgi:hypothetical protein
MNDCKKEGHRHLETRCLDCGEIINQTKLDDDGTFRYKTPPKWTKMKDYSSCTCTYCDNIIYTRVGRMPQTPVCSKECRKKLVYKPPKKKTPSGASS